MVVIYNNKLDVVNLYRESIKRSSEDHVEKDGGSNDDCGEAIHFRENAKRCGYVIYTVSS